MAPETNMPHRKIRRVELDVTKYNLKRLSERLVPYNKKLVYKTDEELWQVLKDNVSGAKNPSDVLLQWEPLLYDPFFAEHYKGGKVQ